MNDQNEILNRIKATVKQAAPDATVILFGSRARGDHREDSDYDVLVLINKNEAKVTETDRQQFSYPLYSLAVDTDSEIRVKLYTKNGWANHRVTPFYENVNNEGIEL